VCGAACPGTFSEWPTNWTEGSPTMMGAVMSQLPRYDFGHFPTAARQTVSCPFRLVYSALLNRS
jgi:hypothetical protein